MKNKKKQTLSLCMIVKNEERFIAGCLESVKEIVDQIVILDTGSTDKTLEIAQKYNAEIHHFKWCDDFSKARNESIKYAVSDWILWLDADERLTFSSSRQLLKELVKGRKPVIYQVQINNKTTDAASAYLSTAYRLFTNKRGIAFKGRIHEQLAYDLNFPKPDLRRSQIIIEHLGYAVEGDVKSEKNERNLKLLRAMVNENPKDGYAHYTLGQHYNLNDEVDLAINHLDIAVQLNQFDKAMTASLFNVLAESYFKKGENVAAKRKAEKSVKLIKEQVGGYYMLYRIAEKSNQFNEGIKAVEMMTKYGRLIQNEGWQISTDVIIDEEKLVYAKAVLEEKSGDHPSAFDTLYSLINKKAVSEQILNKAIQLALNLSLISEAVALLKKLIQFNPERVDAIDTLGTIFIKLQDFPQAIEIYENLHKTSPANENVTRRLAGLYLKTGDEQKASHLLEVAV